MRRLLLLAVAAAVLLIAAWAGVWHLLAGRLDRAVAAGLANGAALGATARCGGQRVEGFPLKLEMVCDGAEIVEPRSGLRAAAAGLRTRTPLYDPDGITVALREAAAAWRDAAVEAPQAELRLSAADGGGATDIAGMLRGAAARLGGSALPVFDADLEARLDQPPQALLAGFDPRRSGLAVGDLMLRLRAGGVTAETRGALDVDGDGLATGRLTLSLGNVDALPALVAALPPQSRGTGSALAGALLAFGRPAELDGAPAKEIDIDIVRGAVTVGMIGVGRLPPLW